MVMAVWHCVNVPGLSSTGNPLPQVRTSVLDSGGDDKVEVGA